MRCVYVIGRAVWISTTSLGSPGGQNMQTGVFLVSRKCFVRSEPSIGSTKPEAVYFEVRVYSVEAGPFPVDAANRDFYFEINGDAIMQVLFKDEPLAIDGNALVMKHWDPEKPMRYVKE